MWGKGWGFKVYFNSADNNNFLIIPLGALAVDNASTGECDIYIQYLDPTRYTQSDQVIFGSLIMQQYKAYFDYDMTQGSTVLKMQISDTNTLTNSYIGNATITQSGSPFTALDDASAVIYVGTDEFHYKTTVRASLGFQGLSTFQVSLLGNYVYAYADDCMIATPGTLQTSCENAPVYATTYFNSSIYYAKDSYTNSAYAGYNTSGEIYSAEVCLNTKDTPFFCTVYNQEFYVAEQVMDDNWNYGSKADSGTVGLGASSPVWAIVSQPATKVFDVYLNNYNGWTWADSNYVVNNSQSVINIGSFDPEYNYDRHTTISPYQSNSYLFALSIFGFGKTDNTTNTEFYTDIMNFDTDITKYGILANTTSLALNFRGLGLPATSFNKFSDLLAVATKGESTCLSRKSGYCALSNPCDYYNKYNLWDYDFKIQFQTNQDDFYLRVPLATFAANYDAEGGVCVVFVEYLQDTQNDGKSIMLGSMFFQSVYAQYTQAGVNSVIVDLFVNKHALASTYIGNDVVPTGDTVFVTPVATLEPETVTSKNGQPTFAATIAGITDTNPYFLLDFSSSHTIVWDINCMTTGIGIYPAGPCSDQPTDM